MLINIVLQKVSINGQEKGSLEGIRAPNNNNPVQSVSSNDLTCGQSGYKSNTVFSVSAGSQVGLWFQHVIGGPQGSNDPDNPIASSHKGPVTAWLAKVDNAASSSHNGLKWFKIWEDGFNTGSRKWGVDNLISNNGWVRFNIPSCVASGQYLLRAEILALHSAGSPGGAQFYSSCAQLSISGSGNLSPSTVSFPGAYSSNDASIVISIYGSSGQPDNNGRSYTVPGPAPVRC